MKKNILFLILLFYIQIASSAYISEIDFIDNEFVEIYSNENLNLNDAIFYDDEGEDKANSLTLVQNKNSPYYLIVGQNFLDAYNYENFDCTIYKTGKTNPGYYGLKSGGEDITLKIDNSTSLSWTKDKDYSFNENETLNYNLNNSSYYIHLKSPCSNTPQTISEQTQEPKLEQKQIQTSSEDTSCNYQFSILPEKQLFTDKIQYKFQTNATDFEIEYWIEDYDGNIAKDKTTTKNKNTKSYTPPEFTQIYILKAKLNVEDCIILASNQTTFYSKHIECSQTSDSSSESSSDSNIKSSISYISIINKGELLSGSSNTLLYEIYKGDTAKRAIYIYQNNQKIHTFELEKYTRIKGRLPISEETNEIKFEGFNLSESITLSKSNPSLPENSINSNQFFSIYNITQNSNKINFFIYSNFENLTATCYIYLNKTKISEEINLNKSSQYSLQVDLEKLLKKTSAVKFNLKLICKYKKSHLKSYNYENSYFNFTMPEKSYAQDLIDDYDFGYLETNSNHYETKYSSNFLSTLSSNVKTQSLFSDTQLVEIPTKYTQEYQSEGKTLKDKSFYFIFVGVVIVLILMLLKW